MQAFVAIALTFVAAVAGNGALSDYNYGRPIRPIAVASAAASAHAASYAGAYSRAPFNAYAGPSSGLASGYYYSAPVAPRRVYAAPATRVYNLPAAVPRALYSAPVAAPLPVYAARAAVYSAPVRANTFAATSQTQTLHSNGYQ